MTAEFIASRCNLTRKIGPISLGINQVLGNFQTAFVKVALSQKVFPSSKKFAKSQT